jgi:hypothetical protein
MLICLPITEMIAVGLAFTAVGLWPLVSGKGDLLELLTLAAVVVGLALVWRVFGIGRRLKPYASATGAISSVEAAASDRRDAPAAP